MFPALAAETCAVTLMDPVSLASSMFPAAPEVRRPCPVNRMGPAERMYMLPKAELASSASAFRSMSASGEGPPMPAVADRRMMPAVLRFGFSSKVLSMMPPGVSVPPALATMVPVVLATVLSRMSPVACRLMSPVSLATDVPSSIVME